MQVEVAAGDAAAAAAVFDDPDADEVLHRTDPAIDDQVATFRLEIDRSHRPTAVGYATGRLRHAGIPVLLSRPLDVAETVSDTWLQELIGGPGPDENIPGPYPRALFAIGGARVVQQLLDIVTDPTAFPGYRDRAAQGCLFALRNTPQEHLCRQVLDAAVQQLRPALRASPTRTRAPRHVTSLVEALQDALDQVASWSYPEFRPVPQLPQELLTELLAGPCRDLHWPALQILAVMPAPLSEQTAAAVAAAAVHHAGIKGPDAAVVAGDAVRALGRCPDTTPVRQALEVLSRSRSLDVRLDAMDDLVHRGGRPAAKALWERLLQNRSSADRRYAGGLIATHGRAEDVPAAITALGQVWTSKHSPQPVHDTSGLVTASPWGAELLTFVWNHREHPAAAAGIQRLRRRWPTTRPDLTAWVAQHLPDLPPPGPDHTRNPDRATNPVHTDGSTTRASR
ncbi:hypothetical protein [Kineococcus sp. SYSU DK002]|uniref:hypothetical protein n=1 Tax=Kineococcus sp. SYSU DK002 TaxID=3383123 RepID=UPI003D7EB8C6